MNNELARPRNLSRLREASEWVQRLSESADNEQTYIEWQKWCDVDPANLRAFEQMEEVWDGLSSSRLARVVSARALPKQSTSRTPKWVPAAWATAATLLVGVVIWVMTRLPDVEELRTDIGEIRHEALPDGSRIDLSADSLVVVRYSAERRSLHLIRGQAFFSVAPRRARPFVVQAGGLSVTAIGTRFDVRTGPDNTVVTVGEGRVRIAPNVVGAESSSASSAESLHADAGQRVRYFNPTRAITVSRVDPRLANSWQEGVLQFQEEPLREVLREVNRYTPRKIVLKELKLGDAPFTGTISQDRVDDWLMALERILPVTIEDREEEGFLIVPNSAP